MTRIVDTLFRFFFVVAFVVIAVAGVALTVPKIRRAQGLAEQRLSILRQIEEKQSEISEIKGMQRRFNTDRAFVEGLARRNHRVYPGEMVFTFDD